MTNNNMEKLKSLHLFTKQTNNYVAFVFKNKNTT